jgi:hypothetical protein
LSVNAGIDGEFKSHFRGEIIMNNEYPIPPPEELTDISVRPEVYKSRTAKVAASKAASTKKPTVLIINDDNDIYFEDDQSVYTFLTAFKSMGYKVRIEESKDTSYSTWKKYDIIVWSCGDDYSPINDIKNMQKVTDYVTDKNARLLLESGNVAGWNKELGMGTLINRKLRETVLHSTTDWVYHDVGDLTLKNKHPIATTPNKLPDTIGFTPTNPGDNSGDANAVRISSDAIGIYNWSHVAYADKLVNDSIAGSSYGLIASEVKNGGRIVYFAFDIDDIDSADIQQKLIQNSEKWLRR